MSVVREFINPGDLFDRLKAAWGPESSGSWSVENPAKGHCSATSLVIHDAFGGSILKTHTPAARISTTWSTACVGT